MGILGFMFGALLVIVIRGLQSLDPLWSPGVGLVFGTLFCAAFFVWGMGAFNPKLSEHGDGHHEEEEAEPGNPVNILTGSVWQIATLLIIALVVLFAFAVWGGLTLRTTADPLASTTAVGYFTLELPFGGPEILISELLVFALFIIWIVVSLVVAAGGLAWVFGYLSRGMAEVQAEAKAGAAALPAGQTAGALPSGVDTELAAPAAVTRTSRLYSTPVRLAAFFVIALVVFLFCNEYFFSTVSPQTPDVQLGLSLIVATALGLIARPGFIGNFIFTFVLLFYLFYWVMVGLVMPGEPMRTLVSLVNALIFAFIILRPTETLQFVGRIAGLAARFVRWLPKLLFQR